MDSKFKLRNNFTIYSYLESIKAWITINRENQIYQWSFTQLIESNDSKAISFANSSVGTAILLPYKGS